MSPIDSYCSRLSALSAQTAGSCLRKCLAMVGITEADLQSGITYAHSSQLVRELSGRYGRRTIAKMLSFWRELIRECWRLGHQDRESADRAMPKWTPAGDAPPTGRHLRDDEIRALARACGAGLAGSRNESLLCLLSAGLRRSEIVGLNCEDWSGDILRVKGKRGRIRELKLPAESAEALDLWLVRRGKLNGCDPLLCSVRGEDAAQCRLSQSGVRSVLNGLSSKAGIAGTMPHDFRRTFVGQVLGSGADIGIVMRLMGHSNPATTLRYDRRLAETAWSVSAGLPSPVHGLKVGITSAP